MLSMSFTVSTSSSATAEGPRHALLVNLCYVSRCAGVTKGSNSESDHEGHSRAVAPFHRPGTICY